ncbi:MAG TPA: glycosyltransferase family 4 protein [Phototrophicaceae bacterium]|nr:glycosyltransferase family 4 protein [Phototrophicaceae bacterium]
MRILLINQAFVAPTEPGHTRHYEIAQFMRQRGDQMTIVASDLNYQTGQRITERSGLFSEQVIDGVHVLRAYIYPALHRSFAWRVLSFISFMLTSIWAGLHAGSIDLVMGTTPPIFQAFSAWVVAFLRRKPFLLEVRDLWPIFAIDMGVLKNPILIKLSYLLENFLYRRATKILVNSPAYYDYMLNKGVSPDKIKFIAYGTDIEMFNPQIDGQQMRRALQFGDQFIVTYAGAMGLANNLDVVLQAAEYLRDEPSIRIVFFGDGKERSRLEQTAKERGLTNVTFAGSRPKEQMPQILAASDACLAILKDIPMFRTTYPNKVFDYMAMARPTVLAIDGVIRQVIEEANGGIYVPPSSDVELAAAIRNLYDDRALCKQLGDNARAYVVSHFDRQQKMLETWEFFKRIASS